MKLTEKQFFDYVETDSLEIRVLHDSTINGYTLYAVGSDNQTKCSLATARDLRSARIFRSLDSVIPLFKKYRIQQFCVSVDLG